MCICCFVNLRRSCNLETTEQTDQTKTHQAKTRKKTKEKSEKKNPTLRRWQFAISSFRIDSKSTWINIFYFLAFYSRYIFRFFSLLVSVIFCCCLLFHSTPDERACKQRDVLKTVNCLTMSFCHLLSPALMIVLFLRTHILSSLEMHTNDQQTNPKMMTTIRKCVRLRKKK